MTELEVRDLGLFGFKSKGIRVITRTPYGFSFGNEAHTRDCFSGLLLAAGLQ